MVLLEAMSCGLPVVASAVGEIPRIVTSTETGWLVGPAQVDQLRWAIGQAIHSSDASRVGAAARRSVVGQFSSATMAARYSQLYEQTQG